MYVSAAFWESMLKIIEEEIYSFSGDSAHCVILNRENYVEKIHVKVISWIRK